MPDPSKPQEGLSEKDKEMQKNINDSEDQGPEFELVHVPKKEIEKDKIHDFLDLPGEQIPESEIREGEPKYSDLVVFGSWIDHQSRDLQTPSAKMRVLAALELWKKNEVGNIIFSGGKTNPKLETSEAEAMRNFFLKTLRTDLENTDMPPEKIDQELQRADQSILLEDQATNTLENVGYMINMMQEDPDSHCSIAGLSTKFHTSRIKEILDMFGIETDFMFDEEHILEQRNENFAQIFSNIHDNPDYYDTTLTGENKWMRSLNQQPKYYLTAIAKIEDDELFKQTVVNLANSKEVRENIRTLLRDEYDIPDLESVDPATLREKVNTIVRELPPAEWQSNEDWTRTEEEKAAATDSIIQKGSQPRDKESGEYNKTDIINE